MFAHVITAVAACSGGEIGETKRPPARARTTTCVESSDDRERARRDRAPRRPRWCCARQTATRTQPARSPARGAAHATRHRRRSELRASPARRASAARRLVRSPPGSRKAPSPRAVSAARPRALQLHPRAVERVRAAGRVRGRVDDPERRRRRVLGRARRVRVQRVALVQQRVDELLQSLTSSSRAAPGSWRRTCAGPRSALRARERVERLGAAAGSSRRRGSARPSRAATPSTGMRHRAVQLHGTCTTCSRSSLAAVEHHPVEVEGQRHVAVGQRVEVLAAATSRS